MGYSNLKLSTGLLFFLSESRPKVAFLNMLLSRTGQKFFPLNIFPLENSILLKSKLWLFTDFNDILLFKKLKWSIWEQNIFIFFVLKLSIFYFIYYNIVKSKFEVNISVLLKWDVSVDPNWTFYSVHVCVCVRARKFCFSGNFECFWLYSNLEQKQV